MSTGYVGPNGQWVSVADQPAAGLWGALVSGAAVRKPYMGVVATRCGMYHDQKYAGFNQTMGRSVYRATQALSQFQVIFANWAFDGSTNEAAIDVTTTVECSIEYPVDVYTRVTFGGSNVGSMASGANMVSDTINLVIPEGAVFWVRCFVTAAGTSGLYGAGGTFTGVSTGAGSYYEGAVWSNTLSAPNYVMTKGTGGSSGNNDGLNGPNPIYKPLAIIALTTKPTLGWVGDSIAQGNNDGPDSALHQGHYARATGGRFGYLACARSGETGGAWGSSSNYARRAAVINQYCTHVVCAYGTNDVFISGAAAATVATSLGQVVAAFPNLPVYVATVIPQTTSTDAWITEANQTVKAQESVRLSLNTLIRTGITGARGIIDVDQIYSSGYASGKFKTFGTGAAITTDGIHPFKLGYTYGGAQVNLSFVA